MEFTHFNENGEAVMVDVGGKEDTVREASAGGRISMTRECLERVSTGRIKKGDVLGVARIAGIMALKQTSNIIPLCHLMNLTYAEIRFPSMRQTAKSKRSAPYGPPAKQVWRWKR